MPADALVGPDSSNTCCNIWRDKYTKLEEKRNALRQAVKLLEQQINKVQAENIHIKKAYEEEKVQKDLNDCGKNDLSSRVCLENEIAALKSEIFSLQEKKDQSAAKEVELLQTHVSERDSEIRKLKDLLETEKRKAEAERKNALVCKKEASEAYRLLKAEKSRVDEQKKHYSGETEKNKEYRLQLEVLKQEADDLKLKLAAETTMLQDTRKKLEAERKKAIKEKKRADLEMSKAKDQQILAEENEKLANGEKARAESLFQLLEEKRCEAEKLQRQVKEILATKKSKEAHGAPHKKHTNVETIEKKRRLQSDTLLREADESIFVLNSSKFVALNRKDAVEKCEKTVVNVPELNKGDLKDDLVINKTIPMTEKDHIDQMSVDLEENKRKVEDLYMQLQELMSSRKLTKATDKAFAAENEKMKLLKKQLKFEKMKRKHAKREVKLEKSQNIVLKHELGRIKLELVHYLHHLDILSKSFPNEGECMNDLEKAGNVESMKRFNLQKNPCNQELMQVSDPYKQTQNHLVPLDSYGGNQASSVTGIDSKLKSMLGGNKEQMLHGCAIDSSTASFSDRQLVGSQEKGAFSFSTPTTLVEDNLNVQGTRSNFSDEFPRKKCYKNPTVVADNSVRSPLKSDEVRRNDENHKKRKRVPDAVGCIKNLCAGNKILHKQLKEKVFFMHEKRGVDKSFRKEELQLLDIHGSALADHRRFQTSACEEEIERQSLCDHDNTKTKLVGTEFFGASKINIQSSQPNDLLSNNHAWPEAGMENLEPFVEAVDYDYMKLLDLDNNADEERYRRAIEIPMSPTLPEIHVGSIESLDSDIMKTLVVRACESFPDNHKQSNVQAYSYDVIDALIKSNLLKSDTSASANTKLINIKEGTVDSSDLKRTDKSMSFDVLQSGKISAQGFQYLDMKMDITDASIVGKNDKKMDIRDASTVGKNDMKMDITDASTVGKNGAKYASEMDLPHAYENILAYCVVFSSIKNDYDVSIVLSSMNNCIARCCAITQKEWAVGKILLALRFEEKLSSREKACVFFSLLLINYCTTALDKFGNFFNWNSNSSLDLFRDHMNTVMSGSEIKSIFMELHFLDELLLLVEDFLIAGKIFRCMDFYNCSSVQVFLSSENKVYSFAPASAYHLMAGGIFLAAISTAIGRVGFLCEVSFNILRMSRYDYSSMLNILHAFAYFGGDKFFNLRDYSLTMTVLKSIVACLKGISSVDAAALTPSIRNVKIGCSSSDRCLFSENVVSIEIVASFLLGLLQKNVSVRFMPEGVAKSFSPICSETCKANQFSSLEELHSTLDSICDTSCGLSKYRLLYSQWDSVNNLTLCDISDVISLIELIGRYASWSWTCINVVPQLLKMLESCAVVNFNAAIVLLLGQLGRFGTSASGYNDTGVVNLRCSLTHFFLRNTSMNAGLPIQIASVSALLCLVSFDFEAMVHNKVNLPAFDCQFSSVDSIKRWFSSLSQKQRDLSFRLFQDAAERDIVG